MYIENKKRSILKTISWRVLATVSTIFIVYIFTGKFLLAVSVGGVEVLLKIVLYFLHERVWNKVNYGRRRITPFVVWFTGLSGAGKSTLANKLYDDLKGRGFAVERLDGDIVRSVFPTTGFTKEDRDNHIKRVGYLASTLEKNGIIVISSFISPYHETRSFVRKLCSRFIEVHVDASLETCEKRDAKGLYKKARKGEIKHFTGIDDPYEAPANPELIINTNNEPVEKSFQQLKTFVNKLIN